MVVKITPSANYRVYNDGTAEAIIRDNDSGDRVMVSTLIEAFRRAAAAMRGQPAQVHQPGAPFA